MRHGGAGPAARPAGPGQPSGEDRPELVELVKAGSSPLAADHLAALAAVAAAADSGIVQLSDNGVLRLFGGFRLPSGWHDLGRVPMSSTVAGIVFDTCGPVVVEDVGADPRVPPDAPVRKVGSGAYAGFPIRDGRGRVVGVCAVLDSLPRPWTAAQLAAIDHAAQACATLVAEQEARRVSDRDRRFLDAVLESLRSPVVACDESGRVVLANAAMRRASPGPLDDFHANRPSSVLGRFHPDGRPLAPQELPLARALRGDRVRQAQVLLRAPGRSTRLMLVDGEPIADAHGRALGAVATFTDITERHQAERFRDCELRVATVLADSSRVEDAAPKVVEAVGSTLGWAQAELWLTDLLTGPLHPAARWTQPGRDPEVAVPEALARGTGLTGLAFDEGRPLWVTNVADPGSPIAGEAARASDLRTALAVPVGGGPRALGVLTLLSVTTQEPEEAVVTLLASIAAQIGQYIERRRAEELELQLAQSKDEYLALVGHELRTPLTSIGAYAALLEEADAATFAADGPGLVRVIARNAAALRDIVDDLLDLAALDTGHAAIRTEPVDLAALVRAAAADAEPAIVEADLVLGLDLPPDLRVGGDPERLRQVVDHLLGNAIKYTPAGGRVDLTLADADGVAAELTVRDTGIGLPPEERERLFDRFFRSSRTRERAIPGAGLSLAISRAIVRRHGGSVVLVPGAGPGTRIVVRLPLAGPSGDRTPAAGGPSGDGTPTAGGPERLPAP